MRIYSFITHIAGWILFLSLPILFVANQSGGSDFWTILISWKTLLFISTYASIFYLNSYLLIPYLYATKKWFFYVLSLLVLLAGVWALQPYDRLINKMSDRPPGDANRPPPPGRFLPEDAPLNEPPPDAPGQLPPRPPEKPYPYQDQSNGPRRNNTHFLDIISIFLFIIILVFSLAINFLLRLRLAEQRSLQADADKANAELSFLKAQINPHFLFNTLNNIYSMAASKSDHTADSIMKLSNIMRYVTDDVAADFVPLENEVDFVKDYIDLQLLRLGKKMTVHFSVNGDTQNKKIAPLVLVTFIENAFKYGVSNHEKTVIVIQINITEKEIIFFSQNKLFLPSRNAERVGIGIANTRKRLEYLYAGKYSLDINTGDEKYAVTLTLQLQPALPYK